MAMRKFVYGDNVVEKSDEYSIEDVKEVMAELFPELSNADYEESADGTVTFTVRSGEKGANRKFVYGDNVVEKSDEYSVEDVKEVMAELFPELLNADHEISDDGTVVTFTVRSGEKG